MGTFWKSAGHVRHGVCNIVIVFGGDFDSNLRDY